MNFKEYQEESKRTCPSLGSYKLDLSHMVLGIFSEYEEIVNAKDNVNLSEEYADCTWYISNYCTFRKYNFNEIASDATIFTEETFTVTASKLQDLVKKYIAYNKEIDSEKEVELLKQIMYMIKYEFSNLEINIEQALQNNIDKLRIRFPKAFDENLAKNRDLESERKELEK